MTDNALTGRTALVTGGTRGIGRACAQAMAAAGADVILTGRDAQAAKSAAAAIAAQTGANVAGVSLDVPEDGPGAAETLEAVDALVAEITAEHGDLDILVANAGILRFAPIGLIGAADLRAMLEVNVVGTLAVLQSAAVSMCRRGRGSAVLISSLVGTIGGDALTAYSATKAAIAAMALSAARDLGPQGVRVNAIAPGITTTDMISAIPSEAFEHAISHTPLRRLGTPDDVAAAAVFLASDAASFITGHVLAVDGGLVV
jgi:3-oxoacyl-[acyl-carrier protein] reductase